MFPCVFLKVKSVPPSTEFVTALVYTFRLRIHKKGRERAGNCGRMRTVAAHSPLRVPYASGRKTLSNEGYTAPRCLLRSLQMISNYTWIGKLVLFHFMCNMLLNLSLYVLMLG